MSIDEGGVDPVEEAFRSLRGEDSMTRRKRVNVLWNPSMDWLALHDAAAGQMKLVSTVDIAATDPSLTLFRPFRVRHRLICGPSSRKPLNCMPTLSLEVSTPTS